MSDIDMAKKGHLAGGGLLLLVAKRAGQIKGAIASKRLREAKNEKAPALNWGKPCKSR